MKNKSESKTLEFPQDRNKSGTVNLNTKKVEVDPPLFKEVHLGKNQTSEDEEEKDIAEEKVNENPPPLEKHQKLTFFFNPMENIILQEEVWKAEPEDEDDDEDNVKEVHLDEGIEYKIVNMTKEAENKKKGTNESSVVHSKTVQMKNHTASGNTTHHTATHTNVHGEQHGKFEAPHHNVTQHHAAPLSEE